MKEYRRIGDLVDLIDERNKDEKVKTLIGVSIDKCFIKSVANTIGTDLSKYQVIRKFDFACSLMQVSRDGKIPIACLKDYDEAIMSPAYYIFRIKNTEEILPDYMAMWFMRPEFDREASYIAVGGVRGSMPWEDFCDMKLPVPDIKEQQKIVDTYNAITKRIQIKQKINENLEKTAQAIYRKMFIEDADESWETVKLCNISKMFAGGDKPEVFSEIETEKCNIPIYSNGLVNYGLYGFTDKPRVTEESITVSARGTIGFPCLRLEPYVPIIRLISVIPNKEITNAMYLYYFLKNTQIVSSGTTQQQLTVPEFGETKVSIPEKNKMSDFEQKVRILYLEIKSNEKEIASLNKMKYAIVSQISKKKEEVIK